MLSEKVKKNTWLADSKTRVCVLKDGIFRYYRKRNMDVPWGVLNFHQMAFELITDDAAWKFK